MTFEHQLCMFMHISKKSFSGKQNGNLKILDTQVSFQVNTPYKITVIVDGKVKVKITMQIAFFGLLFEDPNRPWSNRS